MSKLPKIAIFTEYVGARSQTFIQRQIQELCPEQTVVVTERDALGNRAAWSLECPEFCLEKETETIPGVRSLPVGLKKIVSWTLLNKFLKKHHVTVILGQFLHNAWPYLSFAKKNGFRFYAHAHGYDLSQKFRDDVWRQRYADFAFADGVIVVNQVMRQRLLSVGVPDEKIFVVPCGVDVPEMPPEHLVSENVHCLAVGRLIHKKAPLKTLEAFRLALEKNPRMEMDFVGTGPLFAEVSTFVKQQGLAECVTLHGELPNEEVMRLMQQADLFLQHSVVDVETGDEEGMPVAILEAMANAVPVIATRHAGIPEAVLHGENGLLVPEGDVAGMADCIAALSQDVARRQSMGRLGWQRTRDKYSWEIERKALLGVMHL